MPLRHIGCPHCRSDAGKGVHGGSCRSGTPCTRFDPLLPHPHVRNCAVRSTSVGDPLIEPADVFLQTRLRRPGGHQAARSCARWPPVAPAIQQFRQVPLLRTRHGRTAGQCVARTAPAPARPADRSRPTAHPFAKRAPAWDEPGWRCRRRGRNRLPLPLAPPPRSFLATTVPGCPRIIAGDTPPVLGPAIKPCLATSTPTTALPCCLTLPCVHAGSLPPPFFTHTHTAAPLRALPQLSRSSFQLAPLPGRGCGEGEDSGRSARRVHFPAFSRARSMSTNRHGCERKLSFL